MTELIACLSTGKGTWGHVTKVIEGQGWEKIYLIRNVDVKDPFTPSANTEIIDIDLNKRLPELTEDIQKKLKGRIKGLEVALNVISGSGKEHMAVMAALLKLGIGIRLVALTQNGIKEI